MIILAQLPVPSSITDNQHLVTISHTSADGKAIPVSEKESPGKSEQPIRNGFRFA
jgi:hypothetical protein